MSSQDVAKTWLRDGSMKWLRKKRGNRRVVPTEREVARRRRVWSQLGWATVAIALVAGLPYGVYLAYRQVVESGYFAPETIEIEGGARVSREEILELSGVGEADVNLLDLDVSEVAQRIERHPWIGSAVVETELPDVVRIAVEERELLGLVLDDQLYLVDMAGEIIKPWAPGDVVDGVLVSGMEGRLAAGGPDARGQVLEAFGLAQQYASLGLERWAGLSEVNVDAHLGYTLFVGEHGMEVRLGWDRLPERLQRLWQVYEVLESEGMKAEYVLLDLEEDLDRVAIKPIPRVVEVKAEDVQPLDDAEASGE